MELELNYQVWNWKYQDFGKLHRLQELDLMQKTSGFLKGLRD